LGRRVVAEIAAFASTVAACTVGLLKLLPSVLWHVLTAPWTAYDALTTPAQKPYVSRETQTESNAVHARAVQTDPPAQLQAQTQTPRVLLTNQAVQTLDAEPPSPSRVQALVTTFDAACQTDLALPPRRDAQPHPSAAQNLPDLDILACSGRVAAARARFANDATGPARAQKANSTSQDASSAGGVREELDWVHVQADGLAPQDTVSTAQVQFLPEPSKKTVLTYPNGQETLPALLDRLKLEARQCIYPGGATQFLAHVQRLYDNVAPAIQSDAKSFKGIHKQFFKDFWRQQLHVYPEGLADGVQRAIEARAATKSQQAADVASQDASTGDYNSTYTVVRSWLNTLCPFDRPAQRQQVTLESTQAGIAPMLGVFDGWPGVQAGLRMGDAGGVSVVLWPGEEHDANRVHILTAIAFRTMWRQGDDGNIAQRTSRDPYVMWLHQSIGEPESGATKPDITYHAANVF
jgi:hypothetical protein